MQRVRRSQPKIEAPHIDAGEANIGCSDLRRRTHRRAPGIEIRQPRRCVRVAEPRHAHKARESRCDLSGGKIADQQFPIAGMLSPQERESFATALAAAIGEARRGPAQKVL